MPRAVLCRASFYENAVAMNKKYIRLLPALLTPVLHCLLLAGCAHGDPAFVQYELNAGSPPVKMYWKDEEGRPFRSLGRLRKALAAKGQRLIFAMNGGMYKEGHLPRGLFIQNGKVLAPLDTASGAGNFYLKPNGVFCLTANGHAFICDTENFPADSAITYATQSGPLLLPGGRIHRAFTKGSANVQIRNGVGILPNGHALFAMSKQAINFFDFAEWFRQKGCRQALYLDGFVSRTYLPGAGWEQTEGDFGVIIGVAVPDEAK